MENSNSLPSASISAASSSTTAEAKPPQPLPPSSASQTPSPSPTPIPRTLSSPATPQPSPQLPPPSLSAPPPARPSSSPAAFSRTWQQHTQFSSLQPPSIPASPRGSIAIGVPAGHPSPSPSQPSHFSGSFGQQFGGVASSNVRPQGMQGMGMVGSMGPTSQGLGGGIGAHHQQRPVQSLIRPPSSTSTQSTTQSFQGPGLMRPPSIGSASPASSTTQGMLSLNQPWLSSGSQGKPPLPVPPFRPHIGAPSMQPRSHIPQPQHTLLSVPQQQSLASPQSQQTLPSNQHDHFSQQSRVQQPLPHQHPFARPQVSNSQKPPSIAMAQQNKIQTETQTRTSSESDESGSRILSKRSIHELVSQIDPSERLEPDVEDILVDIAEDFVDSITTFSCSLAKHRKSDTLEAKDILLHLERNWNMMLPGFTGDEIKTYKKQLTSDIHKERIATIKKSILATEAANARSSAGQSAVSMKGGQGKAPANILGSPNFKAREVS